MQVVVGAAIVRERRLLVAQRNAPPTLAGYWELPGGKVEPGEAEPAALVRECHEELGVEVTVGRRVGPDVPVSDRLLLRIWSAQIAGGTPYAHEHRALRWLAADELTDVAWLPADAPLIPYLGQLLTDRAG